LFSCNFIMSFLFELTEDITFYRNNELNNDWITGWKIDGVFIFRFLAFQKGVNNFQFFTKTKQKHFIIYLFYFASYIYILYASNKLITKCFFFPCSAFLGQFLTSFLDTKKNEKKKKTLICLFFCNTILFIQSKINASVVY
jgi:hypothetical protein